MKWKERVGLTLAGGAVLLTCVLVLDIRFAQHRGDGEGFILRHGQSRQKLSGKHFQRQFLDHEPTSNQTEKPLDDHEAANNNKNNNNNNIDGDPAEQSEGSKVDAVISDLAHRRRLIGSASAVGEKEKTFIGVDGTGVDAVLNHQNSQFLDLMEYIGPEELNRPVRIQLAQQDVTIQLLQNITLDGDSSTWDRFHAAISKEDLYREDDAIVGALLDDMSRLEFVNISQKEGGTQLKLVIEFPQEGTAMLKPMRFPREQETLPNHFYFTDFERHNAEIAAFHLDRIMGFRRAPPVVGRLVNMTTELYALAAGDLLRTFFISPAQNLCFHGKCSYFCDTAHAICGSPDQMEASLAAFLPDKSLVPRKTWRHPWRRSYHKRKKAQWEEDDHYCEAVRQVPPYSEGRRLPDIIDLSIFDFISGNMDRHHYETFALFGNETYPIHLDQGRAFGRAKHDEMSILAPLYQCCLVRRTTLATLMRFHHGPVRLSSLMKQSLARDPLDPILAPGHFEAMDRRVAIVLRVIRHCLTRFQPDQVLVGLTEWKASEGQHIV